MKIYVLNDDRCEENFPCEHGLSLYISVDDKNILFDSGQTDIFIENSKKLGLDLNQLDYIVLSHGDYDHGNGLKFLNLNKNIPLFSHTDIFEYRFSKRTQKFGGLNETKEELNAKFSLKLSKFPVNITDNVVYLGEIDRVNDFEKGGLPCIDREGNDYPCLDDSGIAIKTTNGLIVISGCAHSGICNTIEYAKKVTRENRIYAVLGGFHLKEVNGKLEKTIEYFKENNIGNIYLAHCTSDIVIEEFKKVFSEKVRVIKAGQEITL